MAAEFIGYDIDYDSDNDSDVVLTVPVGTADGDLMIFVTGQGSFVGLTPATGWTRWPTISWIGTGVQPDVTCDYKVASGEGATITFPVGGAQEKGLLMVFRGLDAPTDPVTDYDSTHATGDWGSVRPVTSPGGNFSIGADSAMAVSQPIILIGHMHTVTTHGGGGGHDHYNSATGAIDVGTELFDESQLLANNLHSHWFANLLDAGTTRDAANFAVTWTGGENLLSNGSMFGARLFGATEAVVDTTVDSTRIQIRPRKVSVRELPYHLREPKLQEPRIRVPTA